MLEKAKQDLTSQTGLFKGKTQNTNYGQGQSSLASMFEPAEGGGFVDVVNKYQWTQSPEAIKSTAPYVILKEFEINESKILSASLYYGRQAIGGAASTLGGLVGGLFGAGQFDSLEAYKWLFPKDKPTNFVYQLPYFSDINFNVRTAPWRDGLTPEDIGHGAAAGAGKVAGWAGVKGAQEWLENAGENVKTYGKIAMDIIGGQSNTSPTDKPKMWQSHNERTVEIKFPLFNTLGPEDWKANRDLCMLLVNQNLYNKRDYITSLPPVFYEVLIPGQHYSYASCVTDITIYNRGNMRIMKTPGTNGEMTAVVPDAYEVSMSLTDLVMPSKNLFQQINNSKIYTEIVKTKK